jgi:hypothetical protein
MTEINVTLLAEHLTSVYSYVRHPLPNFAQVVHNATASSREENGDDTPPRRLISAKFTDTVELKTFGTRPCLARIVVLLCI